MHTLHIRQQHAVTDPLQRERRLRALKSMLAPAEKTKASKLLCQALNAASTAASPPHPDP
jgi:hypothetical protein